VVGHTMGRIRKPTSFFSSKNSPLALAAASGRLKYASSNLASMFALEMSTEADVAITYDWLTRRSGTPLMPNGPSAEEESWRTKVNIQRLGGGHRQYRGRVSQQCCSSPSPPEIKT